MKIGLIRHFEVIHPYKLLALISSEEFKQWQEGYDTAKTKQNIVDIDKSEWQVCYSSDLSRAVYTAKTVYGNGLIQTKLLSEIEISPFFKSNIKLPFILWTILGRSAWLSVNLELWDNINE
jgi:hypothetical protein